MKNTFLSLLTGVIIAALGLLAGTGCSDHPTESVSVTQVRLSMDLQQPAGVAQPFSYIFAEVIDLTTERIVGEAELTLTGQFAEAVLDSLPAGRRLLFVVQAVQADAIPPVVIYEGQTVAVLEAETTTDILVQMSPAVPMIKLSPRALAIAPGQPFTLTAKAFNLVDLYGASFRIFYPTGEFRLDTAVAAAEVNRGDVIFFFQRGEDITGQPYVAVSVTNTVAGTSIADAAGDVVLADLTFTRIDPVVTQPSPTVLLQTVITALTKFDDTQITNFYDDDAAIVLP
jgi:hypothetical protein